MAKNNVITQTLRLFLPLVLYTATLPGIGLLHPNCEDITTIGGQWYYAWAVKPPVGCEAPGFVPMICTRNNVGGMGIAISNAQSGWLMGFNEPDRADQGNITPEEAAVFWHSLEQAAPDVRLVSPAASQHDPGWLWRMVIAYQRMYHTSPRFDAIAWHIYAPNAEYAKSYILARRREMLSYGYSVPVWITEYAGYCTTGQGVTDVMVNFTAWMEQQYWIERYAWFGSRIYPVERWGSGYQACSLVDPATGGLTVLGKKYMR